MERMETAEGHRRTMRAEVVIRPMEPRDIEPVAQLLADLATEFITWEFEPAAQERFLARNNASAIRDFVSRSYRYHVAELGGELVGFVGVRDNKHLYHLFVAKPMQRRGLGRLLWHFAKRECVANGHEGAFTVNASNNAVPIYERLGFVRDGAAQNSNGVIFNPMKLETDGAAHTAGVLEAISAFLASIGIPLVARRLDSSTLLPGITVEQGALIYDPSLLAWPGDLLHEAGHIAVTPPDLRSLLSGAIPPELLVPHAGEPEATAWAFAAIMALGLPPSVLFHPAGYHGNSDGLIFTYASGCYPGLAGLMAAGMALSPSQAAAAGARPYPSMLQWLRQA